tara:strand:+ start:934 stop:1140 length:207 start_codon:yes stop_codon:yes gene_type:complete
MNIDLSEEEIRATVQLIDLAVKAGGLQVAEAGSIIGKKLTAHIQQPVSEVEESPVFAEAPSDLEEAAE